MPSISQCITGIASILEVEPFWIVLLGALILLLLVVKCIYPWQPKWKSKTTKDKDGNKITTYYHLDE